MIRTTPVVYGTSPYDWNSKYKWQCTWYVYGRCGEKGLPYPCWWDRATHTGTFTDANKWPENYRDPWEVKGPDYIPVENDVVIFNGTYGHVAFIEKVENGRALLSQYMNGDESSFSNYSWEIGTSYTGPLMGYLHCPYGTIDPVARNIEVNQIETTDDTLRIRTKPSLNAEIVGHVQIGYYNVLDQTDADGYGWYEIAKDRWCADITTKFLPSGDPDIEKEIIKYFDMLKNKVSDITKERDKYKHAIDEAVNILTEV